MKNVLFFRNPKSNDDDNNEVHDEIGDAVDGGFKMARFDFLMWPDLELSWPDS